MRLGILVFTRKRQCIKDVGRSGVICANTRDSLETAGGEVSIRADIVLCVNGIPACSRCELNLQKRGRRKLGRGEWGRRDYYMAVVGIVVAFLTLLVAVLALGRDLIGLTV
jgi:hypothetical protein